MPLQRNDDTFDGGPLDVICILRDETTGRYHSAFFEEKPLPSQAGEKVEELKFVRLKSKMHHTGGADTLKEALVHLDELSQQIHLPSENIWPDSISRDGKIGIVWVLPNWRSNEPT